MLNAGTQHGLAKQAHQVVSQHGHAERRFGRPEVVEVEGIEAEVGLQFLDAILAIGPSAVGAPDFHHRQIEAGHERTIIPTPTSRRPGRSSVVAAGSGGRQ